MAASFGKQFLSAVIADGSVTALLGFGKIDHLFRPNELPGYEFVRDYTKTYGAVPKKDTVEKHTNEPVSPVPEPSAYYFDLLTLRYLEQEMKRGMQEATKFLKDDNKDPQEAFAVLSKCINGLNVTQKQNMLRDFRDAHDLIMPDYVSKYTLKGKYGLTFGWPYLDDMTGGVVAGDLVSFVGRPQAGKALRNGTPVLMADGSRKSIETLKVGDSVASVDGQFSSVFGVYAQGVRQVYKVHFGDGRALDADGEHLWKVNCKYWSRPRIMTTLDIIAFRNKAKRYASTLYIQTFEGVFGGVKPCIDPYLLGVLLGDGGLTKGVTITTMDKHIVDEVSKRLPSGHFLVPHKAQSAATSYSVSSSFGIEIGARNEVQKALTYLGLYKHKSEAKFVPEVAFTWSREDRVLLLQGLMDSDGTVSNNSPSFGSSSLMLAEGVARLVRSLGGKASFFATKKTTHLDHHRLTVMLYDQKEVFSLPRKRDACQARVTNDVRRLRIVNVEKMDQDLCTCIAVTHPTRLFIAGDYVVTHNSWKMLYAAMHGWLRSKQEEDAEGSRRLFISMEMSQLSIQQRMASMAVSVPVGSLKKASLTTNQVKKLSNGLLEVQGYHAPFWIMDGNLAATVEDVVAIAKQMKPDAVFIDGAYLLKHPTEKNRFLRVAENCDLIKQELAILAPTVCSWQFAKTAGKRNKKKGEEADMDDIGYTDAIAQLSTIALGLFEDESVETLNRRKVRVLKGRNGEAGEFFIQWQFSEMNFQQLDEQPVEELQYI